MKDFAGFASFPPVSLSNFLDASSSCWGPFTSSTAVGLEKAWMVELRDRHGFVKRHPGAKRVLCVEVLKARMRNERYDIQRPAHQALVIEHELELYRRIGASKLLS